MVEPVPAATGQGTPAAAPVGEPATPEYSPLTRPLKVLLGAMAFYTFATLLVLLTDIQHRAFVVDLVNEVPMDFNTAMARDAAGGWVYFFNLLVLIVTAIFFIRWFYLAYRNLRAMGVHDQTHGTGWAIGAWFVPIICLIFPAQIMVDIWRSSDPELPVDGADWKKQKVTALVAVWWLMWLVSCFAGLAALLQAETLSEQLTMESVAIAVDVFELGLIAVTVVLIRAVTRRQTDRWNQVAGLSPEARGAAVVESGDPKPTGARLVVRRVLYGIGILFLAAWGLRAMTIVVNGGIPVSGNGAAQQDQPAGYSDPYYQQQPADPYGQGPPR